MGKLEAYEKQMLASPDQQVSLTDPDSRSMATSGRGSGVVGYNVQVAVDTEHLIRNDRLAASPWSPLPEDSSSPLSHNQDPLRSNAEQGGSPFSAPRPSNAIDLAGMQCHRDQCRTGLQNDSGQDQVEDAARQHPIVPIARACAQARTSSRQRLRSQKIRREPR